MIPLDRLSLISEKSVPVGVVIFIIYLFIHSTHIDDKVDALAAQVPELKASQAEYNKSVTRIDHRFYRLEEKLHIEHPREDDER